MTEDEILEKLRKVYPDFRKTDDMDFYSESSDIRVVVTRETNAVRLFDPVFPYNLIRERYERYQSFDDLLDVLEKNKETLVEGYKNIRQIFQTLKSSLMKEGLTESEAIKTINSKTEIRPNNLAWRYGSVFVEYRGETDHIVKKFVNRWRFETKDLQAEGVE